MVAKMPLSHLWQLLQPKLLVFCPFDRGETVYLDELIPCFIQRLKKVGLLSSLVYWDPPLCDTWQKVVQPFAGGATGNMVRVGVAFTLEKVTGVDICYLKKHWPWAQVSQTSDHLYLSQKPRNSSCPFMKETSFCCLKIWDCSNLIIYNWYSRSLVDAVMSW